jgi:hypothetical protein
VIEEDDEVLADLRSAVDLGTRQQQLLDRCGWQTEADAAKGGPDAPLNFYRAKYAVYAGTLAKILLAIIEDDACQYDITKIIKDGLR